MISNRRTLTHLILWSVIGGLLLGCLVAVYWRQHSGDDVTAMAAPETVIDGRKAQSWLTRSVAKGGTAAAVYLRSRKGEDLRSPDAKRMIYHLAESEISGIIDRMAAVDQWDLMSALFEHWAETNPAAAMRKLDAMVPPEDLSKVRYFGRSGMMVAPEFNKYSIASKLAVQWLETDPEAAVEGLARLEDEIVEAAIKQPLIEYLAKEDPAEAYRVAMDVLKLQGALRARTFSTGGDGWTMEKIFEAWSEIDPDKAAREALQIGDQDLREHAVEAVAESWAGRDWEAARAWAETLPRKLLEEGVAKKLLKKVAEEDPAEALALVGPWLGPKANRAQVMTADGVGGWRPVASLQSEIFRDWLDDDVEAALTWGESVTDPVQRQEVGSEIVRFLSRDDPGQAGEYALSLPVEDQQTALQELAVSWSKRDSESARAWAESIEDPALQRHFLSKVYERQALQAPEQFAQEFEQTVAPELRAVAAEQIVRQWADDDPSSAAQWLAVRDLGDRAASLYPKVVKPWTRVAPAEAVDWIGGLTDVATRDAALTAFAQELGETMGGSARTWMADVPMANSALRQAILAQLPVVSE